MTKTIFLIGFMGAGKTSLGKKLANKLNIPFFDTDELLEDKFGISITEYFAENGENAFRNAEKQLLNEYNFDNAVVATGGGLPCYNGNMETMNAKGVTIFLNRPPKELQQRLINAKKTRPLIKELNNNELLLYIEGKLQQRLPFYEKATITLDRNSQSVNDIVKCLTKKG